MSPDPLPPKPPAPGPGRANSAGANPAGGSGSRAGGDSGRGDSTNPIRRDPSVRPPAHTSPPQPPAPAPIRREPEARGPRTVTKKELVARIADKTAQTKVVARDIVQLFLDEIIRELGQGNRLEFREFGVFEIKERAARRAQNPRTLEKVDVPAKRVVKFRVGRTMKERVGEIPEGSEHIADGSDTWDDDDED